MIDEVQCLLGRLQPMDIARMVLFLACDDNGSMFYMKVRFGLLQFCKVLVSVYHINSIFLRGRENLNQKANGFKNCDRLRA